MSRRNGLALAILLALLLAVAARPMRAEEAPPEPGIDPAEVGRQLLSPDEAERAKGEARLLERIRQGGDLAAFLKKMSAAQARIVSRETRLLSRWVRLAREGTQQERERARRLLEALGKDQVEDLSTEADTVQPESLPPRVAPDAALPLTSRPTAAPAPVAPAGPAGEATREGAEEEPKRDEGAGKATSKRKRALPSLALDGGVVEVAADELIAWLRGSDDPLLAREAARIEAGRTFALRGRLAETLLAASGGLPEARRLGPVGPRVVSEEPVPLVGGTEVGYRRGVRRTKKGAWTVESDSLTEGLLVQVRLTTRPEPSSGETLHLLVTARDVVVPRPIAVDRVRPAPDVEPVELDAPEWRVASASLAVAPPADGADPVTILFSGLREDRVVVVRLEAATAQAASAARQQER